MSLAGLAKVPFLLAEVIRLTDGCLMSIVVGIQLDPDLDPTRPDFHNRALIIKLRDIRPQARRDERQFWSEFEAPDQKFSARCSRGLSWVEKAACPIPWESATNGELSAESSARLTVRALLALAGKMLDRTT